MRLPSNGSNWVGSKPDHCVVACCDMWQCITKWLSFQPGTNLSATPFMQ
jgi:hypothetical protein